MAACGPMAPQTIVRVTPLPAVDTDSSPAPAEPPATPSPAAAATPQTTSAATPTPLSLSLPNGSAAAIAYATDVAMQPTLENRVAFEAEPVAVRFDEFYSGYDMRRGVTLSDKLLSLDGVEVVMEGYMAPPLKPNLDWFVLTRIRLEFCPFCSSDADWPLDIAVIYLTDDSVLATNAPVQVTGRMEIGSSVDPESGMVSLVRIYATDIEVVRS